MTKRVVALTFHDIAADAAVTAEGSDPFYRIRLSEFETLVSQLRQRGYQTVSSKFFRAWQQHAASLPQRSVMLTFDDGYASHFDAVVPLLVRHRFTGTFFIAVDLVGRPGYMTWEQLRKLVFLGMEIGSHGLSHRPLTEVSPQELRRELEESKRLLDERLGIHVQAMSAPRGFWNRTVANATTQAGYDAVWVSTIGTNGQETSPSALRRVVVRQPFSADRIISMVDGWHMAFWWAANQQFMIRLLKRVLGLYWYEQQKRRLVPNA